MEMEQARGSKEPTERALRVWGHAIDRAPRLSTQQARYEHPTSCSKLQPQQAAFNMHLYVLAHVHSCVHAYTQIYPSIFYLYTCIYTYVRTYVQTHIHAHIDTRT